MRQAGGTMAAAARERVCDMRLTAPAASTAQAQRAVGWRWRTVDGWDAMRAAHTASQAWPVAGGGSGKGGGGWPASRTCATIASILCRSKHPRLGWAGAGHSEAAIRCVVVCVPHEGGGLGGCDGARQYVGQWRLRVCTSKKAYFGTRARADATMASRDGCNGDGGCARVCTHAQHQHDCAPIAVLHCRCVQRK
jgi:hypothetical protein